MKQGQTAKRAKGAAQVILDDIQNPNLLLYILGEFPQHIQHSDCSGFKAWRKCRATSQCLYCKGRTAGDVFPKVEDLCLLPGNQRPVLVLVNTNTSGWACIKSRCGTSGHLWPPLSHPSQWDTAPWKEIPHPQNLHAYPIPKNERMLDPKQH